MTLTPTYSTAILEVSYETADVEVTTGISVARDYVERPAYEGSYEVTPSEETQILSTNHFRMTDDIVINPIPSDWGHITYNGAVLTVS